MDVLDAVDVPEKLNMTWPMDPMGDRRADRMPTDFNRLDDFNREVSAIEVDISLSAKRVIRFVVQPIGGRGPVLGIDRCASSRCWTAVSVPEV